MNAIAPDPFIGREREIETFKQWLAASNVPKILYFCDATPESDKKGGIGKTILLQKCIEIAKEIDPDIAVVSIDFFRIADRNGRRIAERVYKQLKDTFPNWSANAFAKALAEAQQVTTENSQNDANPTETRKRLSEALIADLRELDALLYTMHWALLLVLDTFEVIQENPSVAVLTSAQKFPDDYHFEHIRFLIAGRDAINWTQPNWEGREDEVRSELLTPFSHSETVDYMASYDIQLDPDSLEAAKLRALTGGRPILLGLVKDLLGLNMVTLEKLLSVPPDKFEADLVSRIGDLDNPHRWPLLFMAHAYHRFNFALLRWILRAAPSMQGALEQTEDAGLANVFKLSFVRRVADDEGDFTLHDEMRLLITKYCWERLDPDEKLMRKEVSRCVIAYYEDALKHEKDEQMRQAGIVQILYHKAFLDINDGMQYFTQHFHKALELWQNAYARTLLQEIQKFKETLSPHQRDDLVMEEARLLLKEGEREAALDHYQQLLDPSEISWAEAHTGDILHDRGEHHLAMAEFQEAFSSLNAALALEGERKNHKKYADILNSLGYMSRRQGQFEQAVKYYQESINIYKTLGKQPEYQLELANNLNSLGFVYCQWGRIDEALIPCKTGLNIREKLFSNSEVGEVAVGLSHSTLGHIYLHDGNIVNAEAHLNSALDAFTRTNNKKNLAICHNRLGLLQMKKGNQDKALEHFKIAFKEAKHVDEEAQIMSLHWQGRIHCHREECEEAKSYFEHAITIAEDVHDYYQEAESRIDLARALANLKEHERYPQELAKALAIATRQQHNKLLGKIEKLQGDLSYEKREYQEAFLHYGKLCYFMVQYNPLEYRKALRILTDKLLDLLKEGDSAMVATVLAVLRTYWRAQQLESTFPEFLRVCDDVHEMNF